MISRREFLKTVSCVSAALSPFNRLLNEVIKSPDGGWAPPGIGLKDHTIFYDNGYHYLASIYVTNDERRETRFAYARTADLNTNNWEYMGPILTERHPGWWDESLIWAPHVIAENGTHHMFYTGVIMSWNSSNQLCFTQSILHATSNDPSNLDSWEVDNDFVFQPNHLGMVWKGRGYWSDCRDPMILKTSDGLCRLYYTGLDNNGGIVGMATSENLSGPWEDKGSILTEPNTILESPFVIKYGQHYFLSCNNTIKSKSEIRVSESPFGPWSDPTQLSPGWAHEFFAEDMVSYLTDYTVTVRPVYWPKYGSPFPFIEKEPQYTFLPAIMNKHP